MKVVVCDPIDEGALAALSSRQGVTVHVCPKPPAEAELLSLARDADALIVRSQTKVTASVIAAARNLRVIGRAGAGVDNVDLAEATRRGIVVMNAPEGNSIAAAEHSLSLLMSLARHIPQAARSLRDGRWERGRFTGVELAGKTLGVLGFGRVGREVSRRALAGRMRVLAYDPFVPAQVIRDLGAESGELDAVLAESDFLTLHLPLTPETRGLIGAAALKKVRRGVRIVNCARGELIDEPALATAIRSGQVAGAALDVFAAEPPADRTLIEMDEVIATPHLGASTIEAQRRVGEQIVTKVLDFLATGLPADAVNFPSIPPEQAARLRPFVGLCERIGAFLAQVGPPAPRKIEIRYRGDLAALDTRPLTMAAVKGVLAPALGAQIGYVNALPVAAERGLSVQQTVSRDPVPYSSLVEIRLSGESGDALACSGTVVRGEEARIVSVGGIAIEAAPNGRFLFFRNADVPGVIGTIGTLLGQAGINIAAMALGRDREQGTAVAIVAVDSEVPDAVMGQIRARPEFAFVRQVRF